MIAFQLAIVMGFEDCEAYEVGNCDVNVAKDQTTQQYSNALFFACIYAHANLHEDNACKPAGSTCRLYMQHSLHVCSACACMSPLVHANFACRARMQTCMQACMRGLNVHGLQSMRRLEWVDALYTACRVCGGLSGWMHVHSLQSMRRLEWVDACIQLAE